MPIIFYGVRGYTLPWGSGDFFCPDCTDTVPYAQKMSFTAVHLYFIPIIPFQFQGYVECRQCYSTFQPVVLEWNPQKDPAFKSASDKAMLRAMSLMMMADGHVDDQEVAVIQEIYSDLTNHSLTRDELMAEVAALEAEGDLLHSLADVRSGLNQKGKESVLRASIRVAMADGVLADEEQELLHSVSKVLLIPQGRAEVIWEETVTPKQLPG